MTSRTPALESTSIVLTGSFSPAIFQPSWFALEGLIPQTEADSARNVIVTNEISRFQADHKPGTLKLVIQGERDDGYSGSVNVTVEPSAKVTHGFFVDVNDHFVRPPNVEAITGSVWATTLLRDLWKPHLERVSKIREGLLEFSVAEEAK